MFYAQLDNNVCIGISMLSGEIDAPDMIEISDEQFVNGDLLGREYLGYGEWGEKPKPPEPQPIVDTQSLVSAQSVFAMMSMGVEVPDEKISKAADVMAVSAGLTSPRDDEVWREKVYYSVNTIVTYKEKLYICILSHISQSDWTPDKTASLWKEQKEDYAEWTQPQGAHDAYMKGDKVTYGGKLWASTADGNVWAPGVYGWEEVK